ncbi:hypothetical protein SUGI_0300620 [Cryptomeria japonica]|uniref:protein SPA, chloroplastic n=1 Tax=Cryptomeria japonica TaxID=3369 RepID=UPI002408BE51|nr:protein SPA, chloroplastic [Cryptomeria japonica]GLJ17314.1 hypothetical protein SUGI_0300620 [Cryptomeria japonica]
MAMESLNCHNRLFSPPISCASSKTFSRRVCSRFSGLSTSKFCPSLKILSPQRNAGKQRFNRGYPVVRAIELDQDTIVAVSVGLVSIAVGIGIPVFYEIQINNAANRENDQPCFPCKGTGAQTCRICLGAGDVTVDYGGDQTEVSQCVNCEGKGALTCTTCQGTGIQPRYLDRREFKDDD